MVATPEDVRRLPLDCLFDNLEDDQIQPRLDEALGFHGAEVWGDDLDQGHALLTAHILFLELKGKGAGAKGSQTSAKLGPASRSWAQAKSGGSGRSFESLQLHASIYGQRWEAILDRLPIGPSVAFDGVTGNPTL